MSRAAVRGGLSIRESGASGPAVVLVHGGPGVPGYMAPVARALAGSFRVFEPFQRASGTEPLTVARHVADLDEVIAQSGDGRPALVGHSWGAMLALAHAAAHPHRGLPLVLIGCGTFDTAARGRLEAIREARLDGSLRRRLARLEEEVTDPDERLRVTGNLMLPLYSCDPIVRELDLASCDARAYHESWNDMMRLQDAGVYPAAFKSIEGPVLMLHGAQDPHPGRMILAGLEPVLPQIEYREWERCGHYPWIERCVRDEFFVVLRGWLLRQLAGSSPLP